MSQYFPEPYEQFGGDIKVKVDLSNYATKADIKSISHVDTSRFSLKTNLANLKNWSWWIRYWSISACSCRFK